MRLSSSQIAKITAALEEILAGSKAELYLFGSRVDDKKLGGDIDLLLITNQSLARSIRKTKTEVLSLLSEALGDQKIDLVVEPRGAVSTFAGQVLKKAALLHKFDPKNSVHAPILWIRKSKNRSSDFVLFQNYLELEWSQFVRRIRSGSFPTLIAQKSKGSRGARSKPNATKRDNLGNVTVVCGTQDYLKFNGKAVALYSRQAKMKRSWLATSGMPGSTSNDQEKDNFGPIPEGVYLVNFKKTLDYNTEIKIWDKVKWIIKSPRWGWIVTPLEPNKTTNTYGRNSFFIHGGLFPGSKGCIDLLNENEDFHTYMRMYKRNFKLVVEY